MQPENKNDSVQLSTRYQQYDFAKRHLGGFGGRAIFPIGGTGKSDMASNAIDANYWKGIDNHGSRTGIAYSQEEWNKSDNSNGIRRTAYTDGMRIRRLTPTECERLMGLPDGWTKYGDNEYWNPKYNKCNKCKIFHSNMATEGKAGTTAPCECDCHKVSDSQRYKLAGNGVCIPVVKAIVQRLIKCS
jgi:site-specific DNA-cytosine methylase